MAEFRFNAQRSRARRRRLFIVSALVVLLVVIDVVSGGALRSIVRSASSGLWRASASIRENIANTGYFTSHRTLAAENATLKDSLAAAQEDAAAIEELRGENDQLRALVHLVGDQQGVTAPIVSSVNASPYGTFLLGAGESDGIALNSLVMTADGFVIGTVTELHPHTALISEVLAGGTDTEVVIGTTPATVEGRGSGNGRAEIPRDVSIATGTPAIAPTLGSHPIGIVGRVESAQASASQTMYLSLPINIAALRYVYIVAPRR